jgi:hypothetical protein
MVEQAQARIQSWSELREHLARRYPDARFDDDARVVLDVALDDPPGGTRQLEIRCFDVSGSTWIEVRGTAGSSRYVPALVALAHNLGIVIGSFGVAEGTLHARHTIPLENLLVADLDEIVPTMARLCEAAERLSSS